MSSDGTSGGLEQRACDRSICTRCKTFELLLSPAALAGTARTVIDRRTLRAGRNLKRATSIAQKGYHHDPQHQPSAGAKLSSSRRECQQVAANDVILQSLNETMRMF